MIRSHADPSTRTRVALSVALLVSLVSPFAAAQDRAAARRHFAEAERHYAASEWSEALVEYQAANQAAPMPEFLFNMAQCQRQLGHPAEAMDLYQRFLVERPDAPNRTTVQDLIDEMRRQASAAQPTAQAGGETTAATTSAATTGETADAGTTSAAPEGATAAQPADGRSPLSRIRVTTWAMLGGSAVFMGISGLFALDASAAESDLAEPSLNCKARLSRCLDLQDRGDRSSILRNTFFVLGLAALAGTGVLATLDLTGESSNDQVVAAVVPAVSPNSFALAGVLIW